MFFTLLDSLKVVKDDYPLLFSRCLPQTAEQDLTGTVNVG